MELSVRETNIPAVELYKKIDLR
ncbi:hypothetical protein [Legionella sainthelensi]